MRPIIIDTDPGIDDAIALWLALSCPELDLRGVTAVAGNVPVERAAANAARVLALGGIRPGGLPLHAGMRTPLAQATKPPDEPIHGSDGLGEAEVPSVEWPLPTRHAVDWLEAEVRAAPGRITLIALGPCTNVAALLQRLPDPAMVAEIIVMGGAVGAAGNVTPAAEFNFHTDPEAARIVLQSGARVRLVGLNVTRRALLHAADAERLAGGDARCRAIAQMSRYYIERYRRTHGVAACAMHDPLAVAVAARPDLARWEPYHVDVECRGELTRGMSVADLLRKTGRPANALVAMDVDADAFRAFLMGRLLGERST